METQQIVFISYWCTFFSYVSLYLVYSDTKNSSLDESLFKLDENNLVFVGALNYLVTTETKATFH